MTVTTAEFWSVDGVGLQTYAQNLTSWGGSREAPPPLRGEDDLLPYRAGRRWTPKVVDSRTITLEGWLLGADPDGTPTGQEAFRRNWRALRRLLWTPHRQVDLTRRWYDDTGVLRSATAKAQYAGGLEPEMTSPQRAQFSCDLFLADPWFYGDPTVVPLGLVNAVPTIVTVPGDGDTIEIVLDLIGPMSAVRLTNRTLDPDVWLQYVVVPDGSSVQLDVAAYTARQIDGLGAAYRSVGYVTHDGDVPWLRLTPGQNTLALTAESGTGSGQMTFRPAWL